MARAPRGTGGHRRRDCIDDILDSVGEAASREEIENTLRDLDGAAEERARMGDTQSEAYARARDAAMDKNAREAAIKRRNVRLDAQRQHDLAFFGQAVLRQKDRLGNDAPRLAVEAPLCGVNTPLFDARSGIGNQLSAAARGLGKKVDWVGGAILDMRAGRAPGPNGPMGPNSALDKVFFSRAQEREIFIEKYELDLEANGDPARVGRTRSPEALAIARILQRWDKVRITELNAVGAWIENYAGRMFRTTWDPNRLRRASRPFNARDPSTWLYKGFTEADKTAWVADMMRLLDLRKTFGSADDPETILREMYGGMIDGTHLQAAPQEAPWELVPHPARQVSEHRELHFAGAENALEANRLYGLMPPTDTWLHDLTSDADRWGLMHVFGTRPKEGFESYLASIKDQVKGTPASLELQKWELRLRNRFAWVSGEARRPVASAWSGIVNGWMAVQRMAKLGLTPFAMLADNATISRELGRQGMNFFERNASMITDYFQGGDESAKRKVAALLHTGIMERIQGATARWDVADARAGMLAKLENIFFEWTGIAPMTANKRGGAERMMAQHLGDQRGTAWDALGERERRMMQAFGLGQPEWDLLHTVPWHDLEGTTYLTPDVANDLSDAAVQAYLQRARATGRTTPEPPAPPAAGTPPGGGPPPGPQPHAPEGGTAPERLRDVPPMPQGDVAPDVLQAMREAQRRSAPASAGGGLAIAPDVLQSMREAQAQQRGAVAPRPAAPTYGRSIRNDAPTFQQDMQALVGRHAPGPAPVPAAPTVINGADIAATADPVARSRAWRQVLSQVQAALDAGAAVTYHVEGRAVRVAAVDRDLMRDDAGNLWGLISLVRPAGEASQIEIRPPRALEQREGASPPPPGGEGQGGGTAPGQFSVAALDAARRDLANKLWAYFAERGNFAVLEVGPREKADLYGNPQTDNFAIARRLLMQFKQFPVATITRAWGADIYGGENGLGRVAGVTEFIVLSTLFGLTANWLNSLLKGQDPNAQWRNNPANAVIAGFTRGGAGSIYGDFLLGEWSRFGQSFVETLAGPTFSQINTLAELYSDVMKPLHGGEVKESTLASTAVKAARANLPFANMIFTKWVFDYLIYWRLMEHANPGWAERYERTMKQKAGIEFLPYAGPVAATR